MPRTPLWKSHRDWSFVRSASIDDAEPTFAFRIDRHDAGQVAWSVGYASDLGCGSESLIDAFAGTDVLALEFNHDIQMEHRAERPKMLIDRVLSDSGHLSNEQAGELAAAIVSRSGDKRPSPSVQLHLSRHCNKPELALRAGRAAWRDSIPRSSRPDRTGPRQAFPSLQRAAPRPESRNQSSIMDGRPVGGAATLAWF